MRTTSLRAFETSFSDQDDDLKHNMKILFHAHEEEIERGPHSTSINRLTGRAETAHRILDRQAQKAEIRLANLPVG